MGIHGKLGIPAATQRPIERSIARLVAVIFLFISPFVLFAEEIQLEYEISNNPVGVKDNVYLTIFVNSPEPGKVSVTAPSLPKEIRIVSGPKIEKVAHEGAFRTRISYRLRGEETGRYVIKPFLVSVDVRKAETVTEILEVGRYRNRALFIPLEAEWQIPDGPVYVGQSVPVTLRLLDLVEIPLVETQAIDPPNGAFFEEVQGFGEIETVPAGEHNLYNVPVASFIFTPSQSGRLFLPAAKVDALGETATSAVVRIDVRPLPPEVKESGAVGNFIYTSSLDTRKFDLGSIGVLSILVEGIGNIGYFNMPHPDLGELVETEMTETLDALPMLRGYQGSRRVDIYFLSEAAGDFLVEVPDFGYFNPITETAGTIRGTTYRVTFESISETPPESIEIFPFTLPSYDELITSTKWGAYRKPLNYLWLIPAPLAFLVLLVLKRARVAFVSVIFFLAGAGDFADSQCPDLIPAIEAYESGDFEAARFAFSSCFHESREYPDLAFALALTEYQLQDFDDAIHHVRIAIRLNPMAPQYRDFLAWLNEKLELEKPVAPAVMIHPDVFFYAMIVLLSAGFIAAAIYLMKRKGIYIVLFLLGLLLSAGSCGGLVQTAVKNRSSAAIVYGQPAEVRKIPSITAASWLELPAGYSLRILDSTGDFYLIQTAYGLSGWVERAMLLPDADEEIQ
jgi:tetratricopeptide (TPR) repeat protein